MSEANIARAETRAVKGYDESRSLKRSAEHREGDDETVLRVARELGHKRAYRPGFASDYEASTLYHSILRAPHWCSVCGSDSYSVRAVAHTRKRSLLAWDCRPVCDECWAKFNDIVWPAMRGRRSCTVVEAFGAFQTFGPILAEHLEATGPISAHDPRARKSNPDQGALFDAESFDAESFV